MEKNAIPSTYVKSPLRAKEIALAEQPFMDALIIHDTIEYHFGIILDKLSSQQEEFDERKELSLPVSYDYIIELCNGYIENIVETEVVEKVVDLIFNNFMEEYGYTGKNLVPSIPLGYLLSRINDYNRVVRQQMELAAEKAEQNYIASMN